MIIKFIKKRLTGAFEGDFCSFNPECDEEAEHIYSSSALLDIYTPLEANTVFFFDWLHLNQLPRDTFINNYNSI